MAVADCRFEFAHTPVLTNVCGNPGFALKADREERFTDATPAALIQNGETLRDI